MDNWIKQSFQYRNIKEFEGDLVDWIGDVLYDILPENGYEVRDEQIFTAFQIAESMGDKKIHLAEAGLGTGKTFAYLLSAIPYARYTGKPVVIACATSALQEQIAAPTGDIAALSNVLGFELDVKMAKDPNQYVCDVRANEAIEDFGALPHEVAEWIQTTTCGERGEMPTMSDKHWNQIKWNEAMSCDICPSRGFCKLVKAREEYRKTKDILVVDHETFFYDLWTRDDRVLNGKLPILPQYSAVVFDEGHKILLPALMQAGKSVNPEEIESIIGSIEELQGIREKLMLTVSHLEEASDAFFNTLYKSVVKSDSAIRLSVRRNEPLFKAAMTMKKVLDQLLLELQIEQELYTGSLSENQIQAYEGQIERASWALDRFCRSHYKNQNVQMICWVDRRDKSFWVVPKNMDELLNKHLYSKKMPIILTSATLSNEGDFSYFTRTLGMNGVSTSTIGSPFDIKNQVEVKIINEEKKLKTLVSLLEENGGRALVLTNSLREVKRIRKALGDYKLPFEMLWEDQADRGYLVRKFREEETSVLIGSDYWEGIDIPGDSLTLVVIWQLPFANEDTLVEEQRKEARKAGLDPAVVVDYPEMGLKLKQGCGRLIRKEDDKGTIVILDEVKGKPWEETVMGALPEGARI